MTSTLSSTFFDVPLVNPSPNGLFAATQWRDETGPLRWLPAGVAFRVFNYGGEDAHGVWTADWCASEADLDPVTDLKTGERPEFPDPFLAFTSWAYDECDLTSESRAEVRTRAEQTLRLQEQVSVERKFADRLLADAGTPQQVSSVKLAVSYLEAELAKTNTVGQLHIGAQWVAQEVGMFKASGSALKSPLGHTWVVGGGYVDGLDNVVVATSPTYGWRGPISVQDAMKLEHNKFAAVAERSLVVGVEAVVAAAQIA